MDPMSLVLQFLSGAVGGNISGFFLRSRTRGTLTNTLLGGVGGIGGGTLISPYWATSSIVTNVIGSGRTASIITALIVGAVLPIVASMATRKQQPQLPQ